MRTPLVMLTLALTVSVGACGVRPGLTGNDTGGIITWSPEAQAAARHISGQHCARYGKYARITSVHARYGDYIAFTCAFPRGSVVRSLS
jgi:hypothetical protein